MKHTVSLLLLAACQVICAHAQEAQASAEVRLGERLFTEARFVQGTAPVSVSCASCHVAGPGVSAFPVRDVVPARQDGQTLTPRHAQTLVGALESSTSAWGLLHWDGEFATIEDLVADTITGRNFGWLPDEQAQAMRHFAQVLRGDPAVGALLRGIDPDLATATDDRLIDTGAKAMGIYLKTLRFSRDASGMHNGSPYDAFLKANNLPREPSAGEAPARYARRLHETVAALKRPRLIDDPARKLALHDQPFRFGELELKGMRIFFRGTIGYGQNSSSGNCAECHTPPHFTDFAFHNSGAAQDGYDAVHGAGAFAKLTVPTLAERAQEPDRWLPASAQRPNGRGVFRAAISKDSPERADLGLWNVYGNPDLPVPQSVIEQRLNAAGGLTSDEVLALTLGRFKTPALRDLGQSAPYLHNGRLRTIEEVLEFYRRMSDLARAGSMRNAPKEYHSLHLQPGDIAPLAAFLRSLNENFPAGD